jgi:putative nucleotidyltransferase with HDIG domain
MPSLFKQLVNRVLRPFLLRLLHWTERTSPLSGPRSSMFLEREIHIPPGVVALVVGVFLTLALVSELGWGPRPLGAALILTGALVFLFALYLRQDHPDIIKDADAVALLGVLTVAGVLGTEVWLDWARRQVWVSPYGLPLAGISVLTAVLLHPRVAVVLTLVLSLVFGLLNAFSLEGALVVCFGGMAGIARAVRVRTRRDILVAGIFIFVGKVAALGMLALLGRLPVGTLAFAVKWAGVASAASALMVLGLLPFLELFFSRLSDIRLLELSDVNHPLLKEMSVEAPGTYHHSLITASLAQAAAERLGANGLLCRVGAYFHDIGKLVKPEYFVENQGALGNPHELLPPNMSRIVIQAHVKDGLALGARYNLDRAITDFIAQHHGTSRVEYFYRRAIEQTEGAEDVDEDLYRYPGPRPRTKETAIVMLADSVEASSRSLDDPTHQRLTEHVHRIVDGKIIDGQFDEVPLTLAEIQNVKDSFVNTLVGVYHTRVRYPTSHETDLEKRAPAPPR